MLRISDRLNRIKPSPSSMAGEGARELCASGRDIIGLTSGEPDFDTPDDIKEAAARALTADKTKYTDVAGTPELREAVFRPKTWSVRLHRARAGWFSTHPT